MAMEWFDGLDAVNELKEAAKRISDGATEIIYPDGSEEEAEGFDQLTVAITMKRDATYTIKVTKKITDEYFL